MNSCKSKDLVPGILRALLNDQAKLERVFHAFKRQFENGVFDDFEGLDDYEKAIVMAAGTGDLTAFKKTLEQAAAAAAEAMLRACPPCRTWPVA